MANKTSIESVKYEDGKDDKKAKKINTGEDKKKEKKERDPDNLLNSLDKNVIKYLDAYLFELIDVAYEHDSPLRDKIFKYRMFYEMDIVPKTYPYKQAANIMFPIIQEKTTTLHAQFKRVLDVIPAYEVIPWELTDVDMCEAREHFLEFTNTQCYPTEPSRTLKKVLFDDVCLETILTGTGILYDPFVSETVTRTARTELRSTNQMRDMFGQGATQQFEQTFKNLQSQENRISSGAGKQVLITPEEENYDYDMEINQHKPHCIPREDFVISPYAQTLEDATIHGYFDEVSWSELIHQAKNGKLERVIGLSASNKESGIRDDEEDPDYDYEDGRANEYFNRNDIEVFKGIVKLDIELIKKAAKLDDRQDSNISVVDENEVDEYDYDNYYAGMQQYQIEFCTENQGRTLRIEKYKPFHQLSPFSTFYIRKLTNRFDGIGTGQMLETLLIESNKLFNMFIDSTHLDVMKVFTLPEGSSFNPHDPQNRIKPFNFLKADGIDTLKFNPPPGQHVLMILQQLMKAGGNISGAQENISGQESAADPTAPATKTLALIQQGQIIIGEAIDRFREWGKIPMQKRIQNIYQFGDPSMEYRVEDKKAGALWKEMDREDLALKADYRLRGKTEDLDKITREQNAINLLQVMMQVPEVAQRPESRRILAKNILDAFSHPDRDLILPSEEDLQKAQVKVTKEAIRQLLQEDAVLQARQHQENAAKKVISAKKNAQTMGLIQGKMSEMAATEAKQAEAVKPPEEGA